MDIRPPFKLVALWGTCTVLAAAAGPFGTYDSAGFLYRLLYWGAVVVISSLVAQVCHSLATRLAGKRRPVLADLVMIAAMALVFTPVLFGLTRGLLPREPLGEYGYLRLALYVAIVTAAVCVLRRILPGLDLAGRSGLASPAETDAPRLMRRLPEASEGPILRLSGRDHHVEVVTAGGSHIVRMRFADAIDEMDTVIGYCAHRSHWVARAAIVATERDNGRIQLRLVNGDLIPVSRKYRPGLEEAGVI